MVGEVVGFGVAVDVGDGEEVAEISIAIGLGVGVEETLISFEQLASAMITTIAPSAQNHIRLFVYDMIDQPF